MRKGKTPREVIAQTVEGSTHALPRRFSYYQQTIHEIDPTVNAAGVEASMRLQFGTLDHLDRAEFRREIGIAKACEAEAPGYLRSVAESYGMADEFNYWEGAK